MVQGTPASRGQSSPASREGSAVGQRIDAAEEFARPILRHLRALVHRGCPWVEEAVKWGRPVFLYRGRILCFMAAFTKHCTFGFWGPEMSGVLRSAGMPVDEAGGSLGRLRALAELPPDEQLICWIRQAAALADSGAVRPRTRVLKVEFELPRELQAGLAKRPEVAAAFVSLSPGCRRQYAGWISEAKRPETRERRVAETLARVAEGKTHGGRSR